MSIGVDPVDLIRRAFTRDIPSKQFEPIRHEPEDRFIERTIRYNSWSLPFSCVRHHPLPPISCPPSLIMGASGLGSSGVITAGRTESTAAAVFLNEDSVPTFNEDGDLWAMPEMDRLLLLEGVFYCMTSRRGDPCAPITALFAARITLGDLQQVCLGVAKKGSCSTPSDYSDGGMGAGCQANGFIHRRPGNRAISASVEWSSA